MGKRRRRREFKNNVKIIRRHPLGATTSITQVLLCSI